MRRNFVSVTLFTTLNLDRQDDGQLCMEFHQFQANHVQMNEKACRTSFGHKRPLVIDLVPKHFFSTSYVNNRCESFRFLSVPI